MKASGSEPVNRLLQDVCSVIDGAIDPQKHPDEQFAHYSIPAFDIGNGPVFEFGRDIHSNKLEVRSGCILFSKLNPRIPRVWHVQDAVSLRRICSTEFLVVQPDTAATDPDYLVWMLQTPVFLHAVRSRVQAATKSRERVPDNVVLSTPIPVPSLSEQKRIAAKLDEQMATLARAQAALAAQREAATALRSAVLRAALDPATHPHWSTAPIGQVTVPGTGTWNVIANPNDARQYIEIMGIDQESKSITITHPVVAHMAPSRARNIVRKGDVLVATTRPNLNAVAVVPDNLDNQVCSTGFAVLRPRNSTTSSWLYWNVRSPGFVQTVSALVVGAMYPAVTNSQVKAVLIPLPPPIEQQRVVEHLEKSMGKIDALTASLGDQIATLDALRTSLLNAAFSGKV
jgi:restriction endonuclease S subunit